MTSASIPSRSDLGLVRGVSIEPGFWHQTDVSSIPGFAFTSCETLE